MPKSKRQSAKILSLIDDKANPKKQRYAKKSSKKINNAIVSTSINSSDHLIYIKFIQRIFCIALQTVKCDVCDYRKNVILWKQAAAVDKPSSVQTLVAQETRFVEESAAFAKKKTRKRKRDKTAGLLIPTNTHNQRARPTAAFHNHPKPTPSTANITQQSKHSNKIKPKQNANKKPALKLVAPPQSGMQRKNTLLHLANALKIKNDSNNHGNNKNKLEKMLR